MDSLWRANSDLSIAAGEITRGQRKERTSEAGDQEWEAVAEQVVKNRTVHPWPLQNTVRAAEFIHGCLLRNSSVICHCRCYAHTEFSNSAGNDKIGITNFTAVINSTFPMPASAKLTSKDDGIENTVVSQQRTYENTCEFQPELLTEDKVPFSKQHLNSSSI